MDAVRVLVEGGPVKRVDTPAQTAISDTAALVLALNAKRKGFIAQNTGTTVVKLGLGSIPSQTAYHIALAACTAANDGKGGAYFDDAWTGAVYAISSVAGGTFVIHEFETGQTDQEWALAADWYGT